MLEGWRGRWKFRWRDNLLLSAGENVASCRDGRRLHRCYRSRRNTRARHNRRRRFRRCRLPERFEKFANAFLVRFDSHSLNRLAYLWRNCRFSFRFLPLLCFAGLGREQSQQRCHRNQQNEKQIFEVHFRIVKSLKSEWLRWCSLQNALTNQVPSPRGFSVPAIDSRMEVSAWTFFILT